MIKKKKLGMGLVVLLILSLLIAGCGGSKEKPSGEKTVAEKFDGKIIGIEPGAGTMIISEEVIKSYGLDEYKLVESSNSAMIASLADAIDNEEWIIVTGWNPHWMFSKWDLKFLDDPKGIYGGIEQIHTLVRKGLKEDKPEVYAFLDNFNWTPEDMNDVMILNSVEGADEYQNALNWVEENENKVAKWIPEGMDVEKGKVTLVTVPWDSEIASNNVVKAVLQEKMGYEVELLEIDAGAMYQAVISGDADGMIAAWLPTGQENYYEATKNELIDLGPNLDGTRNGWVVPSYVTIDSIEDLKIK